MDQRSPEHPPRWLGVAVFILSGFAGLVYEATWARYLKGVLGHEAYAQALVLGIFLGGLAVGAALVGRRAEKVKSPLVMYAIIEAVLALAAIYFHDLFVLVRGLIEEGLGATGPSLRWAAMTAMILPQSVLLGATFPLLASAMTRSNPQESGRTVSMLYFANSFGGVMGVLAVGFFLVDLGGLPGSMYAGGIASAAAGLAAWVAHHRFEPPKPMAASLFEGGGQKHPRMLPILALAAFGTGLASLVYEIVWIRMLALVIGSSTRAFEIMLATFILGLAIGGLAIRRWVDHPSRLRTIAWAQLLMGVSVIVTMFFYEEMFPVLSDTRAWLPKTERGYLAYGLVCFLLSLALMFLPTFFAGMTLPLLTREAMSLQGERSLGAIYAWNTLGAIAGIWLAVHVLLPVAGLKNALTIGVVIDLALGVLFLRLARPRLFTKGAVAAAVAVAAALVHAPFAPRVLASGPYRLPFDLALSNNHTVEFSKNGKTSSIAVSVYDKPKTVAVFNNGKSDGSLRIGKEFNTDMYTNFMAASFALMHKPDARHVGLIGLGTGLTAHSLLLSDGLELVETMEIEQAVLEGLGYFWTAEVLRTDPRSRLINTDAKTHIASKPQGSYDIIVSVPSNPWVSGLSSLFTVEHFKQMRRALADDGVLVQWFHVYESNPQAIASILAAAAEVFPDFMLYILAGNDIALVTSPDPAALEDIDPDVLDRMPMLAEQLARVGINSVNDAQTLAVGNKGLLLPYFESFGVGPNSDYFPLLERFAALGFYQQTTYTFNHLVAQYGHLFNGGVLPNKRLREPFVQVSASELSNKQQFAHLATAMLDTSVPLSSSVGEIHRTLGGSEEDIAALFGDACMFEDATEDLALVFLEIMEFAGTSLYPEEMASLWRRVVDEMPCLEEFRKDEYAAKILAYLEAGATGDRHGMVSSVKALIGENTPVSAASDVRALTKMMVALMELGQAEEAVKEGLRLEPLSAPPEARHAVRLVGSHIFAN